MEKLIIILHNIRSAHNVGSLFRTADGAGILKIILTGCTPAPSVEEKLFYTPAEKSLRKTALGAERFVPWEKMRLFRDAWRRYQRDGFEFVALERTKGAIDYRTFKPSGPVALVLGNEVRGLDRRILRTCDRILAIPMRGKKESLNVAVAGGIAIYHLQATIEKRHENKKAPSSPEDRHF